MDDSQKEDAVLRERLMFCVQESVRRVLMQFVNGEILEDTCSSYVGGMIGGFYGERSAIAQRGRRWVRCRLRELRLNRKNRGYRCMVVEIYRLGIQHGKAIKLR